MHRYRFKKKICYKFNNLIWFNLNLTKLKKKKWFFFKKNIKINKINKTIILKNLYKNRLKAKQQIKIFYDLPEYKFKYLLKFKSKNIFNNFIISLERRLDIILYRLNIVKSIAEAKQLINHGKIYINNNKININNYLLNPGDLIYINTNKNKNLNKNIPKYIEYNNNLKKIIFLRKPFFHEIKYPFNLNKNLILNFYKK